MGYALIAGPDVRGNAEGSGENDDLRNAGPVLIIIHRSGAHSSPPVAAKLERLEMSLAHFDRIAPALLLIVGVFAALGTVGFGA